MSLPILDGRAAWIYEEANYDIDLIVGIKNIKITDLDELVKHTMASYDPAFVQSVSKGDLLIAADNFGYGHPHYPAMKAMRRLGIAGVIADSFSPGFFRGELAMGFPLVTCPGISEVVARGEHVRVDFERNVVINVDRNIELPVEPWSDTERSMIELGGLNPYLKARLARSAAGNLNAA
ncbi:2,3-dimethylmalate dehydratase small subunit [Caballeronia hypogeia]|uniref:2,3-dimethylmalate dehydratase small subunit n=1 Tax=Caballeronia hypogeia TaxID=1777140 RepID=A0A158D3E1_9BURK|nr:3-isopropylmalate dehydratase [Caballeronia hypogeia]SAK88880.1 2,3-dimethylmalate dehydratase small subunit [Caballeronia hypogeia]